MLLGRFLEISLSTPDIAASVAFYERLGFRQASVGEVWSHGYAVLTDGRVSLGLHDYQFDSPALTFVRPELREHLPALEACGIRFAFRKTDDDVFNEAGFVSPEGQMVALLEARTFSPPAFEDLDFSLCGRFRDYGRGAWRVEHSVEFWSLLGLELDSRAASPIPSAWLSGGGIALGLYETPDLRGAALTFRGPAIQARLEYLRHLGFEVETELPGYDGPGAWGALRTPEGLLLQLIGSGD